MKRFEFMLFVAAAVAAWYWLGHMGGSVNWLVVKAPRYATVGALLPLHIRVVGLTEPSHLCADLHWAQVHDASKGYLASGGAKPVGREGGNFDFEIRVRATNGLRFVHGIIYLSPNGDWSNHTFAATTDLIPVSGVHDRRALKLVRLPVQQLEDHERGNVRSTAIPRFLTALLLLATSVVAWKICASIRSDPARSNHSLILWRVLAAALTLAGVWELFGLEHWVGMHVRALAQVRDVYYLRTVFQKAIISATVAGAFVFLCFVWRKGGSFQHLLVFFGLYLAISAVNLLSFHSIDQFAGFSCLGITLVEALKFACAAGTLNAVWRAG